MKQGILKLIEMIDTHTKRLIYLIIAIMLLISIISGVIQNLLLYSMLLMLCSLLFLAFGSGFIYVMFKFFESLYKSEKITMYFSIVIFLLDLMFLVTAIASIFKAGNYLWVILILICDSLIGEILLIKYTYKCYKHEYIDMSLLEEGERKMIKKSRKIRIIVVVSLIVALSAIIIGGMMIFLNKMSSAQTVELGDDIIPTMSGVVGNRKISGFEISSGSDYQKQLYSYKNNIVSEEDIIQYINKLKEVGFRISNSFQEGTMQSILLSKLSEDKGKAIEILIQYSPGITSIQYLKGIVVSNK